MAGINKYDQAAQAQFMNTYVPIPFEEMVMAGKQKQDRYDRAAGAVDSAIAAAEEITAIPFSADEIRAKDYVAKMRDIRDKYAARDISDPFVLREMSNELHRSVNKEDIKHIQQSYQGYLGYQKQLAENEQRGTPTPEWDRQKFEGYDSSSQGVFTGTAATLKDPLKESQEFFNNLKPVALGSFIEKIDGVETGRIGTKSGITQTRILEHAKNNIDAFMRGPAVSQMIDGAIANGDTRSRKEIALDYVQSHAPEWVQSSEDNLAYDPFYQSRARGITKDGILGPETKGQTGLYEETSKPENKRYWDKEEARLTDAAAAATTEADKNKALNALQVFKDVRSRNDEVRNAKIETLYDAGLREVYANAVKVLTEKENMSREDALSFVNGLIQNRQTEGDYKNTFDNVVMGLQATPGELFRGFRENLTEEAAYNQIRNTIIGKTPALLANSLTFNREGIMKAGEDMQNSVEQIASSWSKISNNFSTANNKGEVVNSVFNSLNELDSKITGLEKENGKNILNDLNKLKPNSSTYTNINNEYKTDSSGRVTYTGLDGKEHNSAIAQSIKDFARSPENYMNVDATSKRNLAKIKAALDAGMDISPAIISDVPDEQGNIKVGLNIVSKDAKGNINKSKDIEVTLPNIFQNKEEYVKELNAMGKDNLAFNLQFTNQLQEEITSFPWYARDEQIIELDNGTITINKKGSDYTVTANVPEDGVNNVVMASGLSYNELPHRVKDVLYRLTRQ